MTADEDRRRRLRPPQNPLAPVHRSLNFSNRERAVAKNIRPLGCSARTSEIDSYFGTLREISGRNRKAHWVTKCWPLAGETFLDVSNGQAHKLDNGNFSFVPLGLFNRCL